MGDLSLTLEAEYRAYRGQGQRAIPEEMFKMRPFLLKGREQRLHCWLLHHTPVKTPEGWAVGTHLWVSTVHERRFYKNCEGNTPQDLKEDTAW